VLDSSLVSGDPKLLALAQDWLRDTGQAVPAVVASRVIAPSTAPASASAGAPAEPPKPSRYLRGVR